jgi:hypothetical protein
MIFAGSVYADGEDPGWSHLDACPLSHDFENHDESDCICVELAAEYENERSQR